eukprot:TRINITY_DN3747_c0_g2_i1.p1 TRINITY_DN3747_c0_g2~~TRINITY_DN3747_c0_g2_i1.p1  ORF type:complete len:252 (+),score=55.01 TRINITY_DN3747_c0_g2_i1:258-1013(+)
MSLSMSMAMSISPMSVSALASRMDGDESPLSAFVSVRPREVDQVADSPSCSPRAETTRKRKRFDSAPSFNLNFILNEKQEMEHHALILASLSGLDESSAAAPPCEEVGETEQERSTSDDLSDGEGDKDKYDSKKRMRTTPQQLRILEKTYEKEKIPSLTLREELAAQLGMTPRRVQVWFQNKRAKERRIKKSSKQSDAFPEYHQFDPSKYMYASASPAALPKPLARPPPAPVGVYENYGGVYSFGKPMDSA